MTSLFGGGSSLNVNAAGTLVPQSFVPTDGQTVFNITFFTYTIGTNSLLVFINGQKQRLGSDFTETSTTSFTLTSPVLATDSVEVIGFPLASLQFLPAANIIPYLPAGTGAVATDVQTQLRKTVFVTDFGTKGDGVTQDDAPLFNAAIASGAKHIIVPWASTNYLLLSPINMTTGTALTVPPARACGITLDFQTSTDLNVAPNGTCQVLVKHTGVALDMSGSRDCTILNMLMNGDASVTPKVMILSARNSAGSDCGRHRFINCRSTGYWSVAPLYLYGSEENDFFGCHMQNNTNGKGVVTITGYNIQLMSSTFITIATGNQSTTVNNFWGGSFWSVGNSGSVNESVFYLDACADINLIGMHMYCPHGIAYVYVSAVNSSSDYLRIQGIRGEVAAGQPLHGVYFGPAGSLTTHAGFGFTDSRVQCGVSLGTGYTVYCDTNIGLTSSKIEGVFNSIGNGLYFKNLSYSYVRLESQVVVGIAGGTVLSNQFVGIGSNIQIAGTCTNNQFLALSPVITGSNTGNLIYDEGTFTPALKFGGAAVGMTYSQQTGKYTRVGNKVTCLIDITLTAKGSSTGAVSITGLPFTANASANSVCAMKVNVVTFTGQFFSYVGSGGTTIFLQQQTEAGVLSNMAETNFSNNSSVVLDVTYLL